MEWRTIQRLPAYEISDTGLARHKMTQRPLKVNYNRYGVPRYFFYNKGHIPKRQSVVYARDLVAEAFVPNPNNYTLTINIDGDLKNCNASNIAWIAGD